MKIQKATIVLVSDEKTQKATSQADKRLLKIKKKRKKNVADNLKL